LVSEQAALVESLSGTQWTATAILPPGNAPRTSLSGVSCLSAQSCVAVGAYWGTNPGFSRPLAATLSGGAWRTATLSLPADARRDVAFTVPLLRSVACTSPSSCTAVGFYPTSFDDTVPLVETLSGSRWRPAGLSTTGHWSLLWGLACMSSQACVAVGEADGLPMVESLSAGTWSSIAIAAPVGETGSSLQAVTCPSAQQCVAAGGGLGVTGVDPVIATGTA